MKRIVFVFSFLVFSVFFFIDPKQLFAACPTTLESITPNSFSQDFNQEITIKIRATDTCKFNTGSRYSIAPVPANKETSNRKQDYKDIHKIQPDNENTIRGVVQFRQEYEYGEFFPNIYNWVILVCTLGNVNECDREDRLIVRIPVSLVPNAPTPTPTLPPNAPRIKKDVQGACSFQVGSSPEIKLSNAQSGLNYEIYWQADWWFIAQGMKKADGSDPLIIVLPSSQTQEVRKRKICARVVGGASLDGENCITLNFTSGIPPNPSCTAADTAPIPQAAVTPPCSGTPPAPFVCETAIGNINVSSLQDFVKQIFSLVLAIAGIGAIILFIYSGYILMTSGGDKQKVQGARETITSAIAGLIFIIFSVLLLEIIGVHILRIPGFG